jgi:hypothetical protein
MQSCAWLPLATTHGVNTRCAARPAAGRQLRLATSVTSVPGCSDLPPLLPPACLAVEAAVHELPALLQTASPGSPPLALDALNGWDAQGRGESLATWAAANGTSLLGWVSAPNAASASACSATSVGVGWGGGQDFLRCCRGECSRGLAPPVPPSLPPPTTTRTTAACPKHGTDNPLPPRTLQDQQGGQLDGWLLAEVVDTGEAAPR